MRRARPALAALVLTLALALTGCGEDADSGGNSGDSSSDSSASAIPADAEFNQADVDFATQMIPHHAQALILVDMTRGRTLSKPVARIADDIQAAQAPEIEQMSDWLQAWDQPVPETMRDHLNAEGHGDHGSGESGHDMPGMLSDADLAELEKAPAKEFEALWMEAMIAHHEGAVTMAETEIAEGEYADAVAMAEDIKAAQTKEIAAMRKLLEEHAG